MNLLIRNLLRDLENSSAAVAIRESLWLYPVLEIIHIIGIVFLVGAAFMFDLRLIGFSKKLPITDLADYLLPWSRRGLWLVIPSGLLLFATNAETLAADTTFWLKLTFISLAAVNVLIFHRFLLPSKELEYAKNGRYLPAVLSGVLSLVLWLCVIACGRLLAY